MVLVHTTGTGTSRTSKTSGFLFQSTVMFRSNDMGFRVCCEGEGEQVEGAGALLCGGQILLLSEFCARAKNANKKPRTDVLIECLKDLPVRDADDVFIQASIPKIRPLGADGEAISGLLPAPGKTSQVNSNEFAPKPKQRKLADGRLVGDGCEGGGGDEGGGSEEAPRRRERQVRDSCRVRQINHIEQLRDEEQRQARDEEQRRRQREKSKVQQDESGRSS